MEDDMVQTGYPYRLTDVFMHKTNYRELMQYLVSVDAKFGTGDKTNNLGINRFSIPALNGLGINRVDAGISEGTLVGLDKNNPCGTFYYNLDPSYSSDNLEGFSSMSMSMRKGTRKQQ